MRVLKWIIGRCRGTAEAVETPLGHMPAPSTLDLEGLDLSKDTVRTLFEVDRDKWLEAAKRQSDFFAKFGDRLPRALRDEQHALIGRLNAAPRVPASSCP